MSWGKLLAFISGKVSDELLLRNEYLVAENRILRKQIKGRLKLTKAERTTLAMLGKKLGAKILKEVACAVQPKTILGWHRRLVAKKFDGSQQRGKGPGRPPIDPEIENLIVRLATETSSWGYDRIVGVLKALGYAVSDQTVGNVLKRHGIEPAPQRDRDTTWRDFLRRHMDVLVSTDFFTTEVWTRCGLVTYYVLFFMRVKTREVHIAGATPNPNQAWMKQVARNITMVDYGFIKPGDRLIHDRDGKYCPAFDQLLRDAEVKPISLPPRSPNLNPHAERWVGSAKAEVFNHLLLFGERSLLHALREYQAHYMHERPHQGVGNAVLIPENKAANDNAKIGRKERLGGLLSYYHRVAA